MISIFVAMNAQGTIGIGNSLPWHISDDLKRFKRLTMGQPVLMGRRTFESIGRHLPGRLNVVISRDRGYSPSQPAVRVAGSLDEALAAAESASPGGEHFVIGGGEIYRLAYPYTDRIYVTEVDFDVPGGDASFPVLSWRQDFAVREDGAGEAVQADGRVLRYRYFIGERRIAGGGRQP